ncbi:hypothetical protein CYY_005822 [Polysphondylium violaceum]|uniref:Threonine/serine exporter-like N-terminal domain-containing protein n=1 Tax=Polysphondylium violaceum TaxID=133409 RepID=A0A8J4PUG9_9MYCE|nr:hypothetical protein CYY_005822 [Polysphondylium violaceum]
MYNFWERVKQPIAEYRKYGKRKNLINNDNANPLSNTTSGITAPPPTLVSPTMVGAIPINQSMGLIPPIPTTTTGIPVSILKQSQHIHGINPINTPSPRGVISQSGLVYTNTTSPPLPTSPNIMSATTGIPGQTTTFVVPNVVAVPMEIAEITPTTPITAIPATTTTTPNQPTPSLGSTAYLSQAGISPGLFSSQSILQQPPIPTIPIGGLGLGCGIGLPGQQQQIPSPNLFTLQQSTSNFNTNYSPGSVAASSSFAINKEQDHQQPLSIEQDHLQPQSVQQGELPPSVLNQSSLLQTQQSNSTLPSIFEYSSPESEYGIELKSIREFKNPNHEQISAEISLNQTVIASPLNQKLQSLGAGDYVLGASKQHVDNTATTTTTGDYIEVDIRKTGEINKPIPKKKSRFNKEKMKKFKKSVYQILSPETQIPIHIVDNEQMENIVIPFLMELGRALLMSGVPAHRLEYELTLISSTFGIDGHFFTTPTGIFFSFGSPHTILSPYTHFLRIHSTDYNMNRLIELELLADDVIYGKVNCTDGFVRLKNILRKKPLYNDYLTLASFVASSFAIAFFFKAGWIEIGASSLVGLYVGLLFTAAGKWPAIGRVLEALSSCGGAIIASLFNAYIYPVNVFMATLGGIIALAPGLSLTLAVAEISTRNLISGNARLVGVFACLLQLTFGLALGTNLSSKIIPVQDALEPNSLPSWTMFLAVPVAAVSFAVQMKVHPRQIWVIILASILGILGGNWGNEYLGEDVGSFFGSCIICMLGNLYARFFNTSSAVPIMSGIILLVPGSMGVKGLFSVSTGDISGGLELFGGMFMIATSLTIGLLVANLIVRPHKAL